MASCRTEQWVSGAPIAELVVTETSSTGATSTLTWILYCITSSSDINVSKQYTVSINGVKVKDANYNIGGKYGTNEMARGTVVIDKTASKQTINFSCTVYWKMNYAGVYKASLSASGSISIDPKTSYVVSFDANGGSGAPSSVTKWAGTDITLPDTVPTRTGYTFDGWSTSSGSNASATHQSGGIFSIDGNVTLYAVWEPNKYSVVYDANGGINAPAEQVKTYGVDLTLTGDVPTRENYNFVGWGVSNTSTTVSYNSGDVYTTNAAITLYAIWEAAYTPPEIEDVNIGRCDADGNFVDDGTYLNVSFNWKSYVPVDSIQLWVSTVNVFGSNEKYNISRNVGELTSGSVENFLFDEVYISPEKHYYVQVHVIDDFGSSYKQVVIPSQAFSIDFLAGGKGAAFGKVASMADTLDIAWKVLTDEAEITNVHAYGVSADNIETMTLDATTVDASTVNADTLNSTVTNITTMNADYIYVNTKLFDKNNFEIQNGLAAYTSAGIDPDTTLEHLILTHKNTPNGSYMYIRTDFYSSKEASSNRMQTAFPYDSINGAYYRYYYDGEWSPWRMMKAEIYDANERNTGDFWIDGKPIYRKVISVNCSSTNTNVVAGTISNVAYVLKVYGTFVANDNGGFRPPTYFYSTSNYNAAWVTAQGNVYVRSSYATKGYVIVEYTKTTD